MRKNLLELIVCPMCGKALALESFNAQGASSDETESGLLSCECGASYPIIGGIPRLLPAELQSMLWEMHPEFYREHAQRLPEAMMPKGAGSLQEGKEPDHALSKQRETARSFGYEWQAFSEILPEDYEKNFRWYFERFSPDDFKGKRVLDAGCGTGRHTYYASKTAREVIAMDLSQAIEVAARNNRAHTNAHFVQADIYRPPFPPDSFDFIYSLGVLHHLPEPEKGFRSLLRLLRRGGFMNIYLYWNLEGEAAWRRALLSVVTGARRITTRMPHNLLKKVSWVLAAGFEVAFVTPARILGRFNSKLADRVPLGHYRKYSFRVLHTDQFDRFSAPIENRYGSAEVAAWFERAGLKDVKILGGQGWRASGRRPEQQQEAEAAESVEEKEESLRVPLA